MRNAFQHEAPVGIVIKYRFAIVQFQRLEKLHMSESPRLGMFNATYLLSVSVGELCAPDNDEAALGEQARLFGLVDFHVRGCGLSNDITNESAARIE
jgi:hypothetical protein